MLINQMAQPIKSDFRAATRFVLTHRQAGDQLLFQIPYGRYSFVYYGGELAQWLDGPYTNHGMSAAELAAVSAIATPPHNAGQIATAKTQLTRFMIVSFPLLTCFASTHGPAAAAGPPHANAEARQGLVRAAQPE